MNILYVHTHDTGRYIQPYGHAIPTPNLMRLAQEWILFRQAFSCAPTCSPSRAALLTGMNPHSARMLGLAHRGFALKKPSQHLANHLKTHGFETVLCGEQHLITKGQEKALGYSHSLTGNPLEDNPANNHRNMHQDIANAKAVAEYLTQPKQKPFFLSMVWFTRTSLFQKMIGNFQRDLSNRHQAFQMSPAPIKTWQGSSP